MNTVCSEVHYSFTSIHNKVDGSWDAVIFVIEPSLFNRTRRNKVLCLRNYISRYTSGP